MSKTYRRKWFHQGAIIRQRGQVFQVEVNHNGERKRCTWPTLAEAETYAEQKRIEVANRGTSAFALNNSQRLQAVEAFQQLGNIPLSKAVAFYLRHHRPAGGTRTVSELLADYLDAKRKAGRRPDTLTDIKCRIGKLVKKFGSRPMHTLTAAELTGWLDANKYEGVSRANYRRAIMGFFNFAMKKGLLELNPAAAIEKVALDETLPEIFTVAETERLLQATENVYPRLVPAIAIGFFAGLRSAEIEKLDWSAVDIQAKLITVSPKIAKKRRQRHVALSDNLRAWLLPYCQTAGRICPPSAVVVRWRPRIMKQAGLAQWPHNGLRHSFASYHLAQFQDISKTALELGHTRPDVLFNHYRNLVKPADAAAYWKILPTREAQIIQLPAVAS
ncbi:MAG: tyrosine-type recombinase/integrase [Kiritimatiellaeota bacterium]|nr:tyrosine-type recombinase/integrase [Kiritimatiellota bacterium]